MPLPRGIDLNLGRLLNFPMASLPALSGIRLNLPNENLEDAATKGAIQEQALLEPGISALSKYAEENSPEGKAKRELEKQEMVLRKAQIGSSLSDIAEHEKEMGEGAKSYDIKEPPKNDSIVDWGNWYKEGVGKAPTDPKKIKDWEANKQFHDKVITERLGKKADTPVQIAENNLKMKQIQEQLHDIEEHDTEKVLPEQSIPVPSTGEQITVPANPEKSPTIKSTVKLPDQLEEKPTVMSDIQKQSSSVQAQIDALTSNPPPKKIQSRKWDGSKLRYEMKDEENPQFDVWTQKLKNLDSQLSKLDSAQTRAESKGAPKLPEASEVDTLSGANTAMEEMKKLIVILSKPEIQERSGPFMGWWKTGGNIGPDWGSWSSINLNQHAPWLSNIKDVVSKQNDVTSILNRYYSGGVEKTDPASIKTSLERIPSIHDTHLTALKKAYESMSTIDTKYQSERKHMKKGGRIVDEYSESLLPKEIKDLDMTNGEDVQKFQDWVNKKTDQPDNSQSQTPSAKLPPGVGMTADGIKFEW